MAPRRPRVLVLDDDGAQLELVQRLLSSQGFDVEITSNPIGVSNLARKFGPDVVLIDVNIPALSGDQLLPLLRRNSGTGKARLVLFSACDAEQLRHLANKVGADGWIQKGGDPAELGLRLRTLCLS